MEGKTIIFCADGTWNGTDDDDNHDGVPEQTNVLKFFLSLAGQETLDDWNKPNEQEKVQKERRSSTRTGQNGSDAEIIQIAKYLHGVGDSRNPLFKMIGGVFGAGLITRIVRGYTFISRNYNPGDRIVLAGFSRGAYTVRALSGLIADLGLLDNANGALEDKPKAYQLGLAAWYQHRTNVNRTKPNTVQASLHAFFDKLPSFMFRSLNPTAYRAEKVMIEAIGVWDTVGSYGLPVYDGSVRLDPFEFADRKLSANVRMGFHAVSIDERRADFTPILWESPPGEPDTRITQVLFAGAHSDVGGGYPATGLSDCALDWMMKSLRDAQVRYANPNSVLIKPDPLCASHRPWSDPMYKNLNQGARKFDAGLRVHASVKSRLVTADYVPDNLVELYMSKDRVLVDGVLFG